MPVPIAIMTTLPPPAAAPNRCSAQAAALASCSRMTGMPRRSVISRATGRLIHGRCGANRTTVRSELMNPATASPTAAMSWRLASSRTARSMPFSSARDSCGVGAWVLSRTCPSTSTTDARMLVPPTSIPMVSGLAPWPWFLTVVLGPHCVGGVGRSRSGCDVVVTVIGW